MKRTRHPVAVYTMPLLCMAALFVSTEARAGGFALLEMSAAGVGNAHAGNAAAAEDLGTIYYNPAGLTLLPGRRFMAAGSGIRPSSEFENSGSRSATGAPLTGGNGGDAGSWGFVPALFYSTDIRPGLQFGFGMHAPFGLKTEYDDGWAGRYQALKSELKSVNLNPVLAYRVNDQWSVGGGVSANYVNVELSRAIDFGTACVGTLGVAACAPGGFLPQQRDGSVTVKGTDWAFGFNLGALYQPTANTRFGVTYRSRIRHEVSGDARFAKPAGLPARLAASPVFSNTDASADLDLPESVSVSGFMQIDPKWAVMGDVSWLRWSRFDELRIRFANGAPESVTPENWRNTIRVAVGASYQYNDAWKLRGGLAWDQSPVRSEFLTPRIPDADRTWLAFGAQYKLSRQSALDVGYAHLFVKDASINKAEPPLGGTLIGNYENDVNIVSVQYSYQF